MSSNKRITYWYLPFKKPYLCDNLGKFLCNYIADMAIWIGYVEEISLKHLKINISIQYKVMDQSRFHRLVVVSQTILYCAMFKIKAV